MILWTVSLIVSNIILLALIDIIRRYTWLQRHRKKLNILQVCQQIEEFGNKLQEDSVVLIAFSTIASDKDSKYRDIVKAEQDVRLYYDKYVKGKI